MQTTLALAAIAAVAYAAPQGVTGDISPSGSPPAGFSTSYDGKFQITAVNSTVMKRDLSMRNTCPTADGSLVIILANGKLTDQQGRTGYIASNYQFQFDGPPQAGAIYTDGFSVGSNSSLALGSSAVFYECLSGGFYNLYDRHWAAQCEPILIDILPCGGSSSGVVTQASDGQPAGTAVATAVSQISDGQPQAASAIPITQIGDGQPQVPTAVISQIGDGQPQAPTSIAIPSAPISQISDGQPQAATTTPAPISQISDGQPQAPTSTAGGAVISQISDGQPQAPTSTASGAIISQISDGQPQAPTSTASGAIISQISDGQPQVPTSTASGAIISQISDGQPQAPTSTAVSNGTVASPTPSQITVSGGNTVVAGSSLFAVVVGLVAALL